MPDVIVTGLPRSGATLTAALIDCLPNAVCFNSAYWQAAIAQEPLDIPPFCKWPGGDYAWTRPHPKTEHPIRDYRAADGAPLTDALYDPRQPKDEAGMPQPVFFS